MKVIIPAAGTGTRLFPHTHTKPKPMVYIAGKPIIGHIIDKIYRLMMSDFVEHVDDPKVWRRDIGRAKKSAGPSADNWVGGRIGADCRVF